MIVPDLSEIIKGLFIPTASADEILLVVALIGTTVVPYNLFLHASSVQQKYSETSQLFGFEKRKYGCHYFRWNYFNVYSDNKCGIRKFRFRN